MFLLSLIFGFSAHAISVDQIYCNEILLGPPGIYAHSVKNCGPKGEVQNNLCLLNVNCVALTLDFLSAFKDENKKEFNKATPEEKESFFRKKAINREIDWFPSSITCLALESDKGPICPNPDQCKGDLLYKLIPASIDPEAFAAASTRIRGGSTKIIQPHIPQAQEAQ